MSEKNYGNDSQLAEIVKYISDNMKVPVLGAGGGSAFLGQYAWSPDYVESAPVGWLICDGSTHLIADYPEYCALLASQHGSVNCYGGDGITTFATIDLRGEFIRGWGQNSHENQGNGGAVGEHQDGTEIPYVWMNSDKSTGFWGAMYYDANHPTTSTSTRNRYEPSKMDSTRGYGTTRNAYVVESGTEGASNQPITYTSRPTNTSGTFFVRATVVGNPEGHVYSTDEQIVGTWIDGKPIYEKTFALEQNFEVGNNVLNHNISNLGDIISISGGIKLQNGLQSPLQQAHSNTRALCSVRDFTENTYVFGIGDIYVGELTIVRLFFTLQYTKTQ